MTSCACSSLTFKDPRWNSLWMVPHIVSTIGLIFLEFTVKLKHGPQSLGHNVSYFEDFKINASNNAAAPETHKHWIHEWISNTNITEIGMLTYCQGSTHACS